MESLLENKALLYSILLSGGWVLLLASGLNPELAQQFELVEFPVQVRTLESCNVHVKTSVADARYGVVYRSVRLSRLLCHR